MHERQHFSKLKQEGENAVDLRLAGNHLSAQPFNNSRKLTLEVPIFQPSGVGSTT